jgi:hypothetical protein
MKDDFGVFTERMRAAQEAMDPDSPKRRERLDWLNKQLDSFNDLMGQKGSKRKELEDVQADNDKQRVEFRNKQKELMNQAAKDWADLPDDERQRKILDFQHQQAQERGGFERWARGREGNLAGEIDDLGERMEATPWVKQQLAQERGDVLRKKDLIDSREGKAMIGMAFDDLSRAFPGGEKRMSNAMFAGSSEAVSQMNRWKIGGQDVQTRMLMIQEAQKAAMDRLVKIGEQIMQQQAAQEAGAAIVKVVGVGAGGQ